MNNVTLQAFLESSNSEDYYKLFNLIYFQEIVDVVEFNWDN